MTNDISNNILMLLGNGNGTFQSALNYAVGSGPEGIIAGDFNGDIQLDLAVVNANSNTVSVLLNQA